MITHITSAVISMANIDIFLVVKQMLRLNYWDVTIIPIQLLVDDFQ
jgi:hypothetical protein